MALLKKPGVVGKTSKPKVPEKSFSDLFFDTLVEEAPEELVELGGIGLDSLPDAKDGTPILSFLSPASHKLSPARPKDFRQDAVANNFYLEGFGNLGASVNIVLLHVVECNKIEVLADNGKEYVSLGTELKGKGYDQLETKDNPAAAGQKALYRQGLHNGQITDMKVSNEYQVAVLVNVLDEEGNPTFTVAKMYISGARIVEFRQFLTELKLNNPDVALFGHVIKMSGKAVLTKSGYASYEFTYQSRFLNPAIEAHANLIEEANELREELLPTIEAVYKPALSIGMGTQSSAPAGTGLARVEVLPPAKPSAARVAHKPVKASSFLAQAVGDNEDEDEDDEEEAEA